MRGLSRGGKQVWQSLKTDVYSVAKAKLPGKISELRNASGRKPSVEKGKASIESLIAEYIASVKRAADIKPSTVHYREQIIIAIRKTWPGLATMAPRAVTEKACAEWAKRVSDEYSPTRYNNAVDTVRGILEVAIDEGLIYRSPPAKLKKRRPNTKHLELPASDKFGAIVHSVRKEGAWCSKQCGDLLEFLAFSGCRLDEAKNIKWADIEKAGIWVHGDVEQGHRGETPHPPRSTPPLRAKVHRVRRRHPNG